MNPYSSKNRPHMVHGKERRLLMARRMPALNTARALLFIVGILCLSFGLLAGYTEHQRLESKIEIETSLGQGSPESLVAVQQLKEYSAETQQVFIVAGAFGLFTALLARFLYHSPLTGPVIGCILLVVASSFIFYLAADGPVLYIVASFVVLAVYIVAIRAGHQFRLSYARMGRANES